MRAAEVDDEFAGELRSLRVPRPTPAWVRRLIAAFGNGVIAGLVPSAIVLGIYYLANHEASLPWIKIASILAIYGPGVGVSLAVLVEAFTLIADRVARAGHGLPVIANPLSAGMLAGVVAGIAPGAIGVVVFGSYHGPFVGTGLIAFGLISGSVMVAVPLAARARRARGHTRARGIIAIATLSATLFFIAVSVVIAPVIVGSAFAEARFSVADHGWAVGAVAGAIGGGVAGTFVGIVIAIGRSLGVRRA